ncbi:MAG: ribose 5-phosphate isomerase B [Myxococcota bacterium]|nr:ribose 5-phosphate isomerase B [Myxococcota bacterium]
MKIALGSDHGGMKLRQLIAEHLSEAGHTIADHGTDSSESCDYPKFAELVSRSVASGEAELGILVCGSGIGMSIAANKIEGVRAALCFNTYMGRMTRMHNDANVLCLGERVLGQGTALSVVDAFVSTSFEGGRHQRRLDLITQLEKSS